MRRSNVQYIFQASWTKLRISFPAFFVRFGLQPNKRNRPCLNTILPNSLWRLHRNLKMFTSKLISKPDRKPKRQKQVCRHPELKTISISAGWTILNYCGDNEHKVIYWCWRISWGEKFPLKQREKPEKAIRALQQPWSEDLSAGESAE